MSSSEVNLEDYLISLEEIILATENFSPERCIGGGGFGKVYVGELSERWKNRTTAIKRLDQDSYQGEHEFRNEIDMISKFHHENIISFIGYCDEGNEMIIVYDYAIYGSLDQHLQHVNKMCGITWTKRLEICLGAARGLNYLHSGLGDHTRVIHRDFKSANILLDENMVAKVCDFGLSRWGAKDEPITYLNIKVGGTKFYMDPTYHESGILRKESDVYSFGVVLFEMLSAMLVHGKRSVEGDKLQFLINLVRQNDQNKIYNLIDPHIKDMRISSFYMFIEIAYKCISYNLQERPTMATIIERIEETLHDQVLPGPRFVPNSVIIEEGFLNLDPLDLTFPFEVNKLSSCFFHMTNNTCQFIAFKVMTTNPRKYCVRPNSGIIVPGSACKITVTMQASKVVPPDKLCKDRFQVIAVIAPNGATNDDIDKDMFDEENKVVKKYRLRVEYILPANPPPPENVSEESEVDSSVNGREGTWIDVLELFCCLK